MRNLVINTIFIVICACSLCTANSVIPTANINLQVAISNQIVRVGLYSQDGFHNLHNNKPADGYGYEYLQHLRHYTPWKYEYYAQGLDWSETMRQLLDGKIDLMTNVRKTPERENVLAFSKLPMGEASTIITVKSGDTRYYAGDYANWNGIRVGIPNSTPMRKAMEQFAQQHGFTYILVSYNSIEEMLRDLQTGKKLDAAVSTNLRVLHHEWILEQLEMVPFYIAVRKDKPDLLAQLDSAMAQLELEDPLLRSNMWNKYLSQTTTDEVLFSEAEINFIRQMQENGQRFTAVLNPDRYPISYFADGKQRGVIKDIADEIVQRTKLNIVFLPVKTPEEYRTACKNPNVDFIFDQKYRLNEGEQKGLVLSHPYISLSAFLLKNRFAGAVPRKYILVEGYRIAEQLKAHLPDDVQIDFCKTSDEAIRLVASGKYDATCLHSAAAEHAVVNDTTDMLKTSLLPKLYIDLCVGTRDNRNPLLKSIINKSVVSIDENLISEIVRNHAILPVINFSFSRLTHLHPLATFGVPLLLLLIFCGFLIRMIIQRRRFYRLGVVFKHLPIHYFFADAQGKFLQYDLGNSLDRSQFQTLDDIKDDEMRQILKKAIADAFASGRPQDVVYNEGGKKRSSIIAPISESVWGCPAIIGVSHDITELSRNRDEAWKNAEFFRMTLQSIGDGVITTDNKGNIIMLNPAAERMMGLKLADVLGMPHTDYFKIVSSDNGNELESPVHGSLRTGKMVEHADQTDLLLSNGKTRLHISDSSSPITDAKGNIIGAILVFHDVTEEYNRRLEMATELATWEAVAKIANIYHFALDPVTRKIKGSRLIGEVWPLENGCPILSNKWIYHEDLAEWEKRYTAVLAGNQHETEVFYRVMDRGKMRYFRCYMRGSKEPNGKITGMVQDLTDFIEAEQKQNTLQKLWDVCLKNMPLIFFIKSIDDDFRYIQCNEHFVSFIGKKIEEIIDHNDVDIFYGKNNVANIRKNDMQAAASERSIAFSETLISSNGDTYHYQMLKFRAVGFDGKPILICMGLNITDDYNRQQKLDEMLEDWENVANVANIGSYRIDRDMNPMDASKRMAQFWPVGNDNKPLPPEKYLIPEDVAKYNEIYTSIFSGKREQATMLCHAPTPDGMRYLRLYIRRNPRKQNVVSGLLHDVSTLIREQKKREALLVMWQNVADTLPALFFVKNADDNFRLIQVNRNFCNLLEMTEDEIIGKIESDLLPSKEEAAHNANEDRLTMESGTRQDFTEQMHLKNNDLRHFQTIKIPSVDEEGRRILICMSQDISDAQALSEIRKIITSAFETLFSSDNLEVDMRMILKNICEFLGFELAYVGCINEQKNEMRIFSAYRPENTTLRFDLNAFHLENVNTLPWYAKLRESVRDDAFLFDFSNEQDQEQAKLHVPHLLEKAKNYDIRGVHVNYISVKNQPWGCIGFIISGRPVRIFSRDENMLLKYIAHIVSLAISRKNVINQLHEALDKALAADKAKSFFLSSMSHEVRTPLNAVIGFTDLLKDPHLDRDTREEYLKYISDSSNALMTLLNDILDLSKLTSGKSQIDLVITDMQVFINEMKALFGPAAQQKKLSLDFSADGVPRLFVDQSRLRQILFNLIGNAIKYTHIGGITVKISFSQTDADSGTLIIQVSDTGIGIADEDKKKMFEPFVQMSRMRGTNISGAGTGLGLAIVRKIVDQAGGELTVDSTVGLGSTFSIKLSKIALLNVGKEEKDFFNFSNFASNVDVKDKETEKIPRVLFVDDSEITLQILKRMLDRMKVPNKSARSAEEALKLLENESFDILMTDILMSEINGTELAKKVRNNPKWSTMRIVAMSTENESFMYDKNIFDKVILKPIIRTTLQNEIFGKNII